MPATFFGEDFEDGSRAQEAALGWLVGIGRSADGDALVLVLHAPELLPEQIAWRCFRINFILKIRRLQFHEFVRISRVTILAADLAAPVRVDGPAEGHVWFGAVQNTPPRNLEIL